MSENETQSPISEVKAEPPLPSPFYEDGYTRLITIPSTLTGFAPVRLTYRPIVEDEQAKGKKWCELNKDKPPTDYYAPLLATKVLGWDLKNQAGAAVPCDKEASYRRLSPNFYPVLLDIVAGYIVLPDETGQPIPTAAEALKNS